MFSFAAELLEAPVAAAPGAGFLARPSLGGGAAALCRRTGRAADGAGRGRGEGRAASGEGRGEVLKRNLPANLLAVV